MNDFHGVVQGMAVQQKILLPGALLGGLGNDLV